MTTPNIQWLRKVELLVYKKGDVVFPDSGEANPDNRTVDSVLDLSELKIRFDIRQFDAQSPNHASIRVYNLNPNTENKIRKEFTRVVLNAGYVNGAFGRVFDGTIKQIRRGLESATDTYLDILAADGDLGYNWGVVNRPFPAGSTPSQRIRALADAMHVQVGYLPLDFSGAVVGAHPAAIRGKVGFGMARAQMSDEAASLGATWSIQNGKLQVIPLDGYLPGEAVELNAMTGMVGVPEQTEQGVYVRTLLNPKLRIGGLVKINNRDINQVFQQGNSPVKFSSYKDIQFAALVTADGFYRTYVVEHHGINRGHEYYSELVCLAVDPITKSCKPYG